MRSFARALVITVSISALSLFFILLYSHSYSVSFSMIDLRYLAMAFILHFFAWISWSIRIQHLSKGMGKKINLTDAVEALLPSLFLAGITPSSAGGEPLRIYILRKKGMSYGEATAIILGGRFLDLITIIVLSVIALIFLKTTVSGALESFIRISLVIITICSLAFITLVSRPGTMKLIIQKSVSGLEYISGRNLEALYTSLEREINEFYRSIRLLLKTGRKVIPVAYAGTLGNWILDLLVPWVILLGFGIHADPLKIMMIQLLVYVIVLIPITPGSSGIAEGVAFALFSPVAPPGIMGMFVLMWRIVMYYFNLIAGSIAGLRVYRKIGKPGFD